MQRLGFHSLVIVVSFLSVFLWQKSELAAYTIPTLGILTALYLVSTLRKRKVKYKNQVLTVFLLNTSALLLIQTTGGFGSMLFFLLYFLCFYIGFSLKPEAVFVFSLAVIAFFMPDIAKDQSLINITKLASFVLLCPLAYFFGKTVSVREKELKQTDSLKDDVQEAARNILRDVSEVVKSEGATLKDQDVEKLKDIVNQSRKLEKEAE